jgi:hypothetical protein
MILDQPSHVLQPASNGFSVRTQRMGTGKSRVWSKLLTHFSSGTVTLSQIHASAAFGR